MLPTMLLYTFIRAANSTNKAGTDFVCSHFPCICIVCTCHHGTKFSLLHDMISVPTCQAMTLWCSSSISCGHSGAAWKWTLVTFHISIIPHVRNYSSTTLCAHKTVIIIWLVHEFIILFQMSANKKCNNIILYRTYNSKTWDVFNLMPCFHSTHSKTQY